MKFIDTHTHLFLPEFEDDRDQVLENARAEGVNSLLLPNVDSSTLDQLDKLVNNYPEMCFPVVGLHPTSVNENYKEELQIVEKYISQNKIYAIGEIGMDLYWDKTFIAEQKEAFIYQINLAKKHSLPVVIHARESFDEIFDIIKEINDEKLKGVFHAFTGNKEQAEQIVEWGFYIGIGGIVTFKNAGLDKVVKDIDLKNIVLETDSPYLAPVPKRGKRNESSYIKYIAQKIAEIKGVSLQDVADITTQNAEKLFNL